ncbi:MAG: cell envelope integrity protein CreD [Campylobacteraceae bacterium]|jgi:inner membrane protein|nr:cell envelope integrity protein CreD [Campylobacteraceae bacterium]
MIKYKLLFDLHIEENAMTKRINKNIIYKAIAIVVVILLMLIPLIFVQNMIEDRDTYRKEAVSKITNSWGPNVIIAAPILNIPYLYEVSDREAQSTLRTGYAKYAPDNLNIDVKTTSQIRYIGIFQVPVFTAEMTIKGDFSELADVEARSKIEDAFISFEINSLKGISVPDFKWNDETKIFEPSKYDNTLRHQNMNRYDYYYSGDYYGAALSALSSKVNLKDNNTFELKFVIKGSGNIGFYPIAKNNKIHMSSDWQNPNFSGAFLPETKEIRSDGFDAFWDINYLASGVTPRLDKVTDAYRSVFTTSFIIPVDNYKNATRAVKYGVLFIMLTFMFCFVFEIANKKPIHPIQYLLVGFAMIVFYTLLVSISEFINFGYAYFIAAAATISLISVYVKMGIVKDMSKRQIATVALSFTFLYGLLYILLQLQDMALLYGSIGLFVALAAIMYMTKNITWYEDEDVDTDKRF